MTDELRALIAQAVEDNNAAADALLRAVEDALRAAYGRGFDDGFDEGYGQGSDA